MLAFLLYFDCGSESTNECTICSGNDLHVTVTKMLCILVVLFIPYSRITDNYLFVGEAGIRWRVSHREKRRAFERQFYITSSFY